MSRRIRPASDKFQSVLGTNLIGPFVLARECAGGMRERGWGRIVNIGSIMGEVGRAGLHAYCSSKHGIAGLTKSLAAELGGNGICVNCVEPGYVSHPPVSRAPPRGPPQTENTHTPKKTPLS